MGFLSSGEGHQIYVGFEICKGEGERFWFCLLDFNCQLICLMGKVASFTHGTFCCLGSCVCILTKYWNKTRVCIRKGNLCVCSRMQQCSPVGPSSWAVTGWTVECRAEENFRCKLHLLLSTDPTTRQQRPSAMMNTTLSFGEG